MFLPTLTEIRAGRDGAQSHFTHVALDGLPINDQFLAQFSRNLARAIERPLGIDFINAPFDPELFGRRRHRLIIQPAAIQTKQLGLNTQGQFPIRPVHQRDALTSREVRGQIFF